MYTLTPFMSKNHIAAGLALGLAAGCGEDAPAHRGDFPVAETVPDLSVKADHDAVVAALVELPTPLTKEMELRAGVEAKMTWGLNDALTVKYSPSSVSQRGTKVLGFVVDGNTVAVTPEFFGERQTDPRQATAIEMLGVCAETQACEVYNGPNTPSMPIRIQGQAHEFLKSAEQGL